MMRWMLKAKILLLEMNLITETIIKIVANTTDEKERQYIKLLKNSSKKD
jgi:hypothetical protein